MLIWYHGIGMGLLYPYILKKVQASQVLSHNDVIIADFAQIANLSEI